MEMVYAELLMVQAKGLAKPKCLMAGEHDCFMFPFFFGGYLYIREQHDMQWLALAAVSVVYSTMAYLTFHDSHRKSLYFIPACVGLGLISSVLWFSTAKYLDDKNKIYVFSLFWDTIMVCVFYFLPLFMGVKIDKWSFLGILLMATGLVIVKIRNV